MNILDPSSSFILTQRQKKQTAILYHFSSIEYLKGLHRLVADLINGTVEPLLALAKDENRDLFLKDPQWGARNTTENWANNAWPFLKDFQQSIVKDIADRAFEIYRVTDTNNCFRGLSEYSMQWATPDEEENFNKAVRVISDYSNYIDMTLDAYHNSRWTDFDFSQLFNDFGLDHPQIAKFRVRTDVEAQSGRPPPRTGVYVAQDDPLAALQFGWTGDGRGKLRPSKTFGDIGLAALQAVGRDPLWLDDEKMFQFAIHSPQHAIFTPTIYMLGKEHRDYAASAVAEEAFVNRPCKWFFVEIINGEFEDFDAKEGTDHNPETFKRVVGGTICPTRGFYFTPARPDSRKFLEVGETAPEYESQYGSTIWQWDPAQE